MATYPSKPFKESKLNDVTDDNGWNFPRGNVSSTAPGTSDDETVGYWYGSIWVAVGTGAFICIDPTATSAVWSQIA